MSIFDLVDLISEAFIEGSSPVRKAIDYGSQCKDGSHKHSTNTGKDRTPAQKAGDKSRRKWTLQSNVKNNPGW